jgi:hypothetical protein
LPRAEDVPAFAAALRELIELAAADRAFVADDGDALLVTTEGGRFRLRAERA